jgi:hypothetical protein
LPVDSRRILELCTDYGYNDFVKDFVIAPSACAVSILTIAIVDSPGFMDNISGLETALKSGFTFVAGILGTGSGRAGLGALRRLHSGGVPDFIADHHLFSPPLHKRLSEIAAAARSTGKQERSSAAAGAEINEILRRF